jgi:hypothetical protein
MERRGKKYLRAIIESVLSTNDLTEYNLIKNKFSREKEFLFPRNEIMFFYRKYITIKGLPPKYSDVGALFSKGHSNAMHAVKVVVPNLIQTDPNYALKIRQIKLKILDRFKEIDNLNLK